MKWWRWYWWCDDNIDIVYDDNDNDDNDDNDNDNDRLMTHILIFSWLMILMMTLFTCSRQMSQMTPDDIGDDDDDIDVDIITDDRHCCITDDIMTI